MARQRPRPPSARELADAYWDYYRLAHRSDRQDRLISDSFFWAFEIVEEIVHGRRPGDPEASPRKGSIAPAIESC